MLDYVSKAHQIAKQAHQGQVDKAGVDYIKHPEMVASFVNGDLEKAAAYLHDVLEDTDVTTDELKNAKIPNEVIEAVSVLTKQQGRAYFDYLEEVKANKIARTVKIADLTHNSDMTRLETVSEKDKQRIEKYQKALAFLK